MYPRENSPRENAKSSDCLSPQSSLATKLTLKQINLSMISEHAYYHELRFQDQFLPSLTQKQKLKTPVQSTIYILYREGKY